MIELSKEVITVAFTLFIIVQYAGIIYGLRRSRTSFLMFCFAATVLGSAVFFAAMVVVPQVI